MHILSQGLERTVNTNVPCSRKKEGKGLSLSSLPLAIMAITFAQWGDGSPKRRGRRRPPLRMEAELVAVPMGAGLTVAALSARPAYCSDGAKWRERERGRRKA